MKELAASEATMNMKYWLLAKTFVYSLLHHLVCKVDHLRWQTC